MHATRNRAVLGTIVAIIMIATTFTILSAETDDASGAGVNVVSDLEIKFAFKTISDSNKVTITADADTVKTVDGKFYTKSNVSPKFTITPTVSATTTCVASVSSTTNTVVYDDDEKYMIDGDINAPITLTITTYTIEGEKTITMKYNPTTASSSNFTINAVANHTKTDAGLYKTVAGAEPKLSITTDVSGKYISSVTATSLTVTSSGSIYTISGNISAGFDLNITLADTKGPAITLLSNNLKTSTLISISATNVRNNTIPLDGDRSALVSDTSKDVTFTPTPANDVKIYSASISINGEPPIGLDSTTVSEKTTFTIPKGYLDKDKPISLTIVAGIPQSGNNTFDDLPNNKIWIVEKGETFYVSGEKKLTFGSYSTLVVLGSLILEDKYASDENIPAVVIGTTGKILIADGGNVKYYSHPSSESEIHAVNALGIGSGTFICIETSVTVTTYRYYFLSTTSTDFIGSGCSIPSGTVTLSGKTHFTGDDSEISSSATLACPDGELYLSTTISGTVSMGSGTQLDCSSVINDGGVLKAAEDVVLFGLVKYGVGTSGSIYFGNTGSDGKDYRLLTGSNVIVLGAKASTSVSSADPKYQNNLQISGTFLDYTVDNVRVGVMDLSGNIIFVDNVIMGPDTAIYMGKASSESAAEAAKVSVYKNSTLTLSAASGTSAAAMIFDYGNSANINVYGTLINDNSDKSFTVKRLNVHTGGAVLSSVELTAKNCLAALYKTSVDDVVTYNYTMLDVALKNAPTSVDKNVRLLGPMTMSSNVDMVVASGVTLSGAKLTVSNQSSFMVDSGATCTLAVDSDALYDHGGSKTYTGIDKAFSGTSSGDTIDITTTQSSLSVSKNTTLKSGVTLTLNSVDLVIPSDYTFTVGGTIKISGSHTLTVNKTLEVSGTISLEGGNLIMSSSALLKVTSGAISVPSGSTFQISENGSNSYAYCESGSMKYWCGLSFASQVAGLTEISTYGSLKATTVTVPAGVTVNVKGASLDCGTLTLTGGASPAKLVLSAGSSLNGSYILKDGTRITATSGSTESTFKVTFGENKLNMPKADFVDLMIIAGTETISGEAVECIKISGTVSDGVLTTDGFTFTEGLTLDSPSTSTYSDAPRLVIASGTFKGSVTAGKTNSGVVVVGTPSKLSDTSAWFSGEFKYNGTGAMLKYANGDVSDVKTYDGLKNTAFTVILDGIGLPYCHSFGKEGSTLALPDNPTALDHYFDGWYTSNELTSKISSSAKVGDYLLVYGKMAMSSYDVTFKAVDGVTYILGEEEVSGTKSLKAGSYTLVIKLKEGYGGTPVVTGDDHVKYASGMITLTGGDGTITVTGIKANGPPMFDTTQLILIGIGALIVVMTSAMMYITYSNRREYSRRRPRRR